MGYMVLWDIIAENAKLVKKVRDSLRERSYLKIRTKINESVQELKLEREAGTLKGMKSFNFIQRPVETTKGY